MKRSNFDLATSNQRLAATYYMLPDDITSPEFIAARDRALSQTDAWKGHDALDPQGPSGHAYGLRVSTRLTSDFRTTHRKQAMDITPQEVIDCLVEAGVKNWVLMGLHGYVGYLPMPRATQDVDVMVPYSQKTKAAKAISERWPELEKRELSQVPTLVPSPTLAGERDRVRGLNTELIRFLDPGDLDTLGNPKPVVDLMLPWGSFQETILKQHVIVDEETGNRLPAIEAAIVSKYAAMISPHRSFDKKEQDAVDLRRLIKNNHADIDMQVLQDLAGEVWEGGVAEIIRFVDQAINDQRFGS